MNVADLRKRGDSSGAVIVIFLLSMVFIAGCSSVAERDLVDLRSPNVMVKKAAIERIPRWSGQFDILRRNVGRANEKQAALILLELLKEEKEPREVQLSVMRALTRLNDDMEVSMLPLLEKLDHQDRGIRFQAVETLAKLKTKGALDALVELLHEENNKLPIIWALGEIGSQEATPTLNDLLESDDQYVRYNAHQALVKIGASRKARVPSWKPRKDFLVAFGSAPFSGYQKAMTNLFGWLRDQGNARR